MGDGPLPLGAIFSAAHPLFVSPLESLRQRTSELSEDLTSLFRADRFESGLVLFYAGLDAMAWLNRPRSNPESAREDFKNWVERFLLPGSSLTCTWADLYGARCGLLHSLTPESKLNREGIARKAFYFRTHAGERRGIIQLILNEPRQPLLFNVDHLLEAFHSGCKSFQAAVAADGALKALVTERVRDHYFSSVVIQSGA